MVPFCRLHKLLPFEEGLLHSILRFSVLVQFHNLGTHSRHSMNRRMNVKYIVSNFPVKYYEVPHDTQWRIIK